MAIDPLSLVGRLDEVGRCRLATLPTPLEPGGELPGGARLWVKRDDLTGLGLGGNKARKLELLCAEALAAGATCLVTVGAGQSNHCRTTAAAGAVLGLEVHLVLAGERPEVFTGNQLLSERFGAHQHFTGTPAHHWGELEVAREQLTDELAADGLVPHSIPIGGSTAVGALGYVAGFVELMAQCDSLGIDPAAVVVTSSSGGTHAGLVAGRALRRATGAAVPEVLAIGVAKGVNAGAPDVGELARESLALLGGGPELVRDGDVVIDPSWLGDDYGIPSPEGDAAIGWAARAGAWVLDRTYTGKGFAGLLGHATAGRWPPGSDVVWIHTGGVPAVFAPGGSP